MPDKKKPVSAYFSFIKVSHTFFSLPFALIGFTLGIKENGNNLVKLLLLVILSVLFARNAAMGFNRWADREIDKKNPRTALREMPREIILPRPAMIFVMINCLFFIITTYFLNHICFFLSPVALLVILGYSLTKRFTSFSHIFLGLSLSLAPIGAYLAVTAHFAILPILYSIIVIFWVAAFDILYALQDVEFDQTAHLHSIPERFGKVKALAISAILHLFAIALIIIAGFYGHFHMLYWIGTGVFSLILIYEHLIVKPNDLSRVNLAFATMNGTASVLFAVFVILDIVLH
ncbi:MAG: UbiA-like polyprenyltransferase [Bacteroidota bacterium]|nr:UbiA-like polyprenyltransferase [Bacteroidota bacterium]